MQVESKVMEHVKQVLKQFGENYLSDQGQLKKNKVITDLNNYDQELISALLKDE